MGWSGNKRFYTLEDGSQQPSVTTILSLLNKPALMQWAANCAIDFVVEAIANGERFAASEAKTAYRNVSKDATDIGTMIHEYCEKYLRATLNKATGSFVYPDDSVKWAYEFISAFASWCKEFNVTPLTIEKRYDGDGYSGRCDMICEMDSYAWENKRYCKKWGISYPTENKRVITCVDFKTGKGAFYDDWSLQTSAYRRMADDEETYKIEANGVLKFNKENGRINYKDFSPLYETDYQAFTKLKEFFWLKEM